MWRNVRTFGMRAVQLIVFAWAGIVWTRGGERSRGSRAARRSRRDVFSKGSVLVGVHSCFQSSLTIAPAA